MFSLILPPRPRAYSKDFSSLHLVLEDLEERSGISSLVPLEERPEISSLFMLTKVQVKRE